MRSGKFFDDRPIARRGPSRQPKTRILIVCEGRVTEPLYFKAFKQQARNQRVHLTVAKETGVPLTVVQVAVKLRREAEVKAKQQRDVNHLWDEVWGVFDVDDHPNLQQAVSLALSEGISLAISNPSFELWALLHFQDQRAHVTPQQVRTLLRVHLPDYNKELGFAAIGPGYLDAVRRAEALDREASSHGVPGRNPTTGVYMLTEAILTKA